MDGPSPRGGGTKEPEQSDTRKASGDDGRSAVVLRAKDMEGLTDKETIMRTSIASVGNLRMVHRRCCQRTSAFLVSRMQIKGRFTPHGERDGQAKPSVTSASLKRNAQSLAKNRLSTLD